jgi:hypothetical protein
MFIAGKWRKLEGLILSVVRRVQNKKGHMFSLTYRRYIPKYQHIHQTLHDHIHIYIENMSVTVELFYGTWGVGKGKEKDSQQYGNTLHLCR